VVVASELDEVASDGGDRWEVPPASGERGRAGAEETRGAVAWWRGREQERGEKEQEAGESVGGAGDGGPIYVDGTAANGEGDKTIMMKTTTTTTTTMTTMR
jgi:hypothetical protein